MEPSFQLIIKVDHDYFCVSYFRRQEMQSEQLFDFVRFVRSVRKPNSHKIRCSVLFDLRTRSNTNRTRIVRSVFDPFFVRFCSIRYAGIQLQIIAEHYRYFLPLCDHWRSYGNQPFNGISRLKSRDLTRSRVRKF